MKIHHVCDTLRGSQPFECRLRGPRMAGPLRTARQRRKTVEGLVQIVPTQAPHHEAPAAGNGHAFGDVIQHDIPVVLPAIHEYGDGQIIRIVIGPQHEIGLAGDAHTVALIQQHLWLQPPAPACCKQPPDRLALEQPFPQRKRHPFGFTAQHFHKAFLQHALQQGVAGGSPQPCHRFQMSPVFQHLAQQAQCGTTRDQLPVMTVAVAVDAAIAAIGFTVMDAGTGTQRVMGALEYLIKRFCVAHQFLQVAGTARHAVVDHQKALRPLPVHHPGRGGLLRRFRIGHANVRRNTQVSNGSMKAMTQPQLQRRNETQQGPLLLGKPHLRQEKANALTGKLPVQENALQRLHSRVLAVRAPGRMVAPHVLGLAGTVQHATLRADAKTRAGQFLPRNFHR